MSKPIFHCQTFQLVFGLLLLLIAGNVMAAFQQDNSTGQGFVVAEAENFHNNTPQGSHSWSPVTTPAGFSGTGAMRTLPDNGTNVGTNYAANSPRLDYQIDFVTTGLHYVWVRGAGSGGGSNSVHAGLDNQEIPSSAGLSVPKNTYGWVSGSFTVATSGAHTLNIWMREDGTVVDKVLLTTDASFVPTGIGPPESPQGGLPTVATPTIAPMGGSFTDSVTVTLASATQNALLYYTLDGSDPTVADTLYSSPFALTNSATLKVIGILAAHNDSAIASASFTITPGGGNAPPVLDPIGNRSVEEGQTLSFTVTASDPDATIPDLPQPTNLPTGASFTDNNDGTGDFVWLTQMGDANTYPNIVFTAVDATDSGLTDSETISITVNAAGGGGGGFQQDNSTGQGFVVAEAENFHNNTPQGSHSWSPVTTPAGFSGTGAMRTLPDNGTNVGTNYAANSPRLDYQIDFVTTGLHYVWVRGAGSGGGSNSVHAGLDNQEIPSSAGLSVPKNTYGWVSGSFTVATSGAHTLNIWMREDGTVVDKVLLTTDASFVPTGIGPPESPQGGLPTVATPTIAPMGGSFTDSVTVTLASATQNALLYYTLDGSDPTVADTLYSSPFALTNSATLKVIGILAAHNDSAIASASFTITPGGGNAPPVLDPIGNRSVEEGQTLSFTVTASDPDATIPDLPQPTNLPTGASFTDNNDGTGDFVWLTQMGDANTYPNIVFTAVDATDSGLTDSETISITVNAAGGGGGGFQQDNSTGQGFVVAEAENFHNNTPQGSHSWSPVTTPAGFSGTGAMRTLPDNGTNVGTNYAANSPRLDYQIDFVTTGLHYVWVRGAGSGGGSNSVHAGLDNQEIPSSAGLSVPKNTYGWVSGSFTVATSGAHTLNIWMREDGTVVDKVLLTTDASFVPTGIGPPESPQGGLPTVATPTIAPMGGSFTDSVTVTLASATQNALLYYTLDGSDPTVADTLYSSPFALTNSATLKVIGILAAHNDSAIASASFTITPGGGGLPIFDDFSDGNADGWTVVNDSGRPSDWLVTGAGTSYRQRRNVSGTSGGAMPLNGSYHLGSYSYLDASLGLTDYRFSVEVAPRASSGEDAGVMFRYQDNDNYYRLSFNSDRGFTRFEKKVSGNFTTLAKDSRGYLDEQQTLDITVEVNGPLIQVYLNNDPLFSVRDLSLTMGGVALYTRDDTRFDNIAIVANDTAPAIVIATPLAYSVLPNGPLNLSVSAIATNVPTNGSVEFLLDNVACTTAMETSPGQFDAQCNNILAGEHFVDAILRDSNSVEITRDTNQAVGVGGNNIGSDYFIAVGDSITNGTGDNYRSDNASQDGRTITFKSWASLLGDHLSTTSGLPNIVANEGISGDTLDDNLTVRLASILERNPLANRALILLGANDARIPVASGAGCDPQVTGQCDGTFKGNMIEIINMLPSGTIPVITLIPPAFGDGVNTTPYLDPLNGARSLQVQEYNDVIVQEITTLPNVELGADLFSCYLSTTSNRSSLFIDNLHFTGLGYAMAARLIHDAVVGTAPPLGSACPAPLFILEDISRAGYKQNLLEKEDRYYVDESFTLDSIPIELVDGRWIMTANTDRLNNNTNFLSFDVGSDPVTVYIAYDSGAAVVPSWLASNGYSLTSLQVTASGGGVEIFNLYSKTNITGVVTLDGNQASGGTGSNQYLVIVVKN